MSCLKLSSDSALVVGLKPWKSESATIRLKDLVTVAWRPMCAFQFALIL